MAVFEREGFEDELGFGPGFIATYLSITHFSENEAEGEVHFKDYLGNSQGRSFWVGRLTSKGWVVQRKSSEEFLRRDKHGKPMFTTDGDVNKQIKQYVVRHLLEFASGTKQRIEKPEKPRELAREILPHNKCICKRLLAGETEIPDAANSAFPNFFLCKCGKRWWFWKVKHCWVPVQDWPD